MGRALLGGLLDSGLAAQKDLCATARSPARLAELGERLGVRTSIDNQAAVRGAEVVILCVKPKQVVALAREIAPALTPDQCVLSIAAGVRLASLAAALPEGQPLVRCMPNTPCLVRSGVTVLSPGPSVGAGALAAARALFESMGAVLVLDEEHMDAVTGLSASGPAFVYVILESLAEGGVMVGLPRRVATELAARTVLGAAQMVLSTERHPAELKDAVTTPAGCTISALLTLEDGKLRSVLARGVQQAAKSAAELAS
jgi:pyrroline-5-carboxylate reductase